VVKATVVGILCLIILAGAWHAEPSTTAMLWRWAVLVVMLLVVFFSERAEFKEQGTWDTLVPTGIVLLAMLALAVIGFI
jgi:hypothetical protein